MMSAVEEAKTDDTKKEETKMDTVKESSSKEEVKTEHKGESCIEAVVTETTTSTIDEKAPPKAEVSNDEEIKVSGNVKDKADIAAQEPSKEDLDSSSTQLETSMEVDASAAEVDANVPSETIKCIPESQEFSESMETSDVKEKEEGGGKSAGAEETKAVEEQPKSSVQSDEKKEELMEETNTAKPSPPAPLPLPASGETFTEDKKHQEENVDDWEVFASDDEERKTCKQSSERTGVFEPPASVIIELFEKLDKEGVLELEWKCPGRRPPEEDMKEKTPELEVQPEEKPAEEQQKEEEEPTAFDFDVPDPIAKVTPRRAPGSAQAQGSGKKRVARMDKVLNDIMRHKNIDDKDFEFGDDDNEMDTTPQRKHNKFHIRRDLDA